MSPGFSAPGALRLLEQEIPEGTEDSLSNCPSIDDLERFVSGGLDRPSTTALDGHVAQCADCQQKLDQLSDDPELGIWRKVAPAGSTVVLDETELNRLLEQFTSLEYFQSQSASAHTTSSPPSSEEPIPDVVGRYRIRGVLGAGATAVVYEAFDPELERVVAVKVLRPERVDGISRARFVNEARALARLNHPQVVAVYGVVAEQDAPAYLVTERVHGPSLRQVLNDKQVLTPRTAARIIVEVAKGLAAVHQAKLVHRDVKPSNIMLSGGAEQPDSSVPNEQPSSLLGQAATTAVAEPQHARLASQPLLDVERDPHYQVKLADFGLVRFDDPENQLTLGAVVVGTPAYMSPEQASGRDELDGRSDVYSLGATLYESLTGAPPFRGTPQAILRQIAEVEPAKPSRLNPVVPSDLETICLKAMDKSPARRYPSAPEFGDDLQRWLNGEPILARPIPRTRRMWRWCRRNPRTAGLTIALIFSLVTGFSLVIWQWRRAEREADLAKAHSQRAEMFAETAQQNALRAKDRFQQLRWAVDRFYRRAFEEEVLTKSTSESFRKETLSDLRSFYENFLQENEKDPGLRTDVAESCVRAAQVGIRLANYDDSLALCERANQILDELIGQDPGQIRLYDTRAKSHQLIGEIRFRQKDLDAAAIGFQRSSDDFQWIIDRSPDNMVARRNYVTALGNLGAMKHQSDPPVALKAYRQVAITLKELSQRDPQHPLFSTDLAKTYSNMATLVEPSEGVSLLDEAITIWTRLMTEQAPKGENLYKRHIGLALSRMAALHVKLGRDAETEAAYRRGRNLLETAVNFAPHAMPQRGLLVDLVLNFGDWLSTKGRHDEALDQLQFARTHIDHLLAQKPDDPDAWNGNARYWYQSARTHRLLNQFETSLAACQHALTQNSQLVQLRPDDAELHDQAARIYQELADVASALHQEQQSLDALQKAVGHQETACQRAIGNERFRQTLQELHAVLARRYQELGQSEAAAKLTRQQAVPDGNEK